MGRKIFYFFWIFFGITLGSAYGAVGGQLPLSTGDGSQSAKFQPSCEEYVKLQNLLNFWLNHAQNYGADLSDMNKAYEELSRIKHYLKKMSQSALDAYTHRKIEDVIDLLRLLQLRTIIKAVNQKLSSGASKQSVPSKEWLTIRRNRLAQLLNRFQSMLKEFPCMRLSPPGALGGGLFLHLYDRGKEAYNVLESSLNP